MTMDRVRELEAAFDNLKDAYDLACAKLHAAETERDAALVQLRIQNEKLDRLT